MLTFANKGACGWARALMIVMLSLSLTLSMPAKPAMAVGVPVFDSASFAKLFKSLIEQMATKVINMAMQKLMQEANKALGPVLNMPILGEILQPTLDGISQDLTGMLTRGSNDLMGNIFRSPQQNFQDCMNSFACTSNIQLSNDFTASFSSPAFNNANTDFTVLSPAQLPEGLSQYGAIAGKASYPLAFAAPPVQDGGFYTADLTNGASIKFSLPSGTNVGSMTSLPANVTFTTTDAAVSPDFLKTMNLNIGNGAIRLSAPTADGSVAAPTVKASPAVKAAIVKANTTNQPQEVSGITINPGQLSIENGQIVGNVVAGFNFGNVPVSAAFGTSGNPKLTVQNLDNVLCPNLTPDDKAGGKICGAAQTAISGLLGCVSGGNIGNCAKNVGQNTAQQLLGGIGQALGDMFKGKSNSGLQVQAAEQALYAQYFCPENDNTPQCIAQKTALRNADLAYSATAYIANAKAWQVKFPQIKADCDKAVAKATKNGDANSLQAGKIIQIQCYNGMDVAFKNLELEESIVRMKNYIVTAPTAIPPKG